MATAVVSCTVFDGLEVAEASASASAAGGLAAGADGNGGTGGAASGAGGTAGAGGAEPKVGYLSDPGAAILCARVLTCDEVGSSIRASTGLPIDPTASFSHCMTWLAGPLPSDRQPTAAQVEMLEKMVAARSCKATREAAWVETLGEADARCDGHNDRRCPFGSEMEVFDCTSRKLVERCGNALLGAETLCTGNNGHTACATGICGFAEIGGHCVANSILYCLGSLDEVAGCTERGLVCNSSARDCRAEDGVEQGCDMAGHTACDGTVVKVCTEGIGTTGEKVRSPFDCAKVGAGTICKTAPAIHCAPAAPGCSLLKPDACIDGKHIQLCMGGEPRALDCGGIGMECIPDAPARCGKPTVP